jgi:peptidoglycan/LPS O-acetylase OafA/YrhL
MQGERDGGRLPHVPALDGLRGVAVAIVVGFHLGRLKGGFLGVDLFFVLSGFLITSLLVNGWRAHGRMGFGAFWSRRARRLLPAMLVVVGAVAVYARWWADPLELETIRGEGFATLGYVANWHQVLSHADYWDTIRSPSPLLHTWSLAIEEQFYVVWPLVVGGILVLSRRAGRGLTPLLVVTAALATASAVAMATIHHGAAQALRVYLGTDTRAAALLFGAVVALVFARREQPVGRGAAQALEIVGVVALAGLAIFWVRSGGLDGWLYEGGMTACSAAAAVVIAAIWAAPAGLLATAFSLSPLRFLGRISYGLYLWHWPVIVVVNPLRTGLDGLPLDALRVAIALAIATVSYHVLEMPIRRGTVLHGRPAWVGALAVPVLCAVAVVAATVARPTPFSGEIELAAKDPSKLVMATDTPDVVVPTTKPAAPGTTPDTAPAEAPPRTILVVGDSGAYYLGKGMTEVGNQRGIAVYSRGIIGCSIGRVAGPFRKDDGRIVTQPGDCGQVMDRWRFFLGLSRPDLVVLTLAWPGGGGQQEVDGHWRTECDTDHDARLEQVFEDELRVLQLTGAPTVATTIPYRISPFDPTAGRDGTDCRNRALRAAASATDTRVVDLAAWACPDGRCDLERDGVKLRPDLVHFAGQGAEVAGAWLLDQLDPTHQS